MVEDEVEVYELLKLLEYDEHEVGGLEYLHLMDDLQLIELQTQEAEEVDEVVVSLLWVVVLDEVV